MCVCNNVMLRVLWREWDDDDDYNGRWDSTCLNAMHIQYATEITGRSLLMFRPLRKNNTLFSVSIVYSPSLVYKWPGFGGTVISVTLSSHL